MEERVTPQDIATGVFEEVYNNGPFSSFLMVNAIASHLELSPTDILEDPEKLKNFKSYHVTKDNFESIPFLSTWRDDTGRCTSFALKVVYLLQESWPDTFKFEFFDVGKHRIARCQKTELVIDSSSDRGAVYLKEAEKEDEELRGIDGLNGKWRFYEGLITFERNSKSGIRKVRSIPAANAIGKCLEEVARKAIIICLFRKPAMEVNDCGIIEWHILDKKITLTPNLTNPNDERTIDFSGQGTADTLLLCLTNLTSFIHTYGNEEQWDSTGIGMIHASFWKAAENLWGPPIWSGTNIGEEGEEGEEGEKGEKGGG